MGLTSTLTSIANALRSKGYTGTIKATDFAGKVRALKGTPEWVGTTLPEYSCWTSVTYGNGKYVAVGSKENSIAYSVDGINWTLASSNFYCSKVAYGQGIFVAVPEWSSMVTYSYDGINWAHVQAIDHLNWTSIAYGNGKFVAFSETYDSKLKIAYSSDGLNWTQSTIRTNVADGYPYYVTYGNGKFAAVTSDDTYMLYSADGINWGQNSISQLF